ncbi:hypothetical protein RRG08_062299 [Elysia crispata]|uniref:Uncharacterized protein n=1 Tax=Elysia crispata TaxID=231223 RepID=A0AAE1CYS7_9GAST|nr:hypothetical protein RRG08_062299 [Elysia crispata]
MKLKDAVFLLPVTCPNPIKAAVVAHIDGVADIGMKGLQAANEINICTVELAHPGCQAPTIVGLVAQLVVEFCGRSRE